MTTVQLDRDNLSTRLEQSQKIIQEAEEGQTHQTYNSIKQCRMESV